MQNYNSKFKILLFIVAPIFTLTAIFFVFVPVFQGKLYINPVLNLGFFQIRWYGLIFATAILVSYLFARYHSWRFGISNQDVDDYSFWVVIVGLVGARIFYVLFNLDFFSQNPGDYKIWHGGLAIYGGILSGLIFTYFYTRKKAYSFDHLFDLIALSLPLGQAVGRFGNFINAEAYGTVTDLPWKMYVRSENSYHHPAFLYEAILDILVFLVLYKLLGRTKSGMLGLLYLISYSLGRFFIEAIRTDSLWFLGFRVSQITAFLIILFAGILALRKHSKLVS
jgi:phosphatidylglycerol:prolipoprotein diacylglycerol transferase